MYVDPNTGGMLFQVLAASLMCCLPLGVVGGVVGSRNLLCKEREKNQQSDFAKDFTS